MVTCPPYKNIKYEGASPLTELQLYSFFIRTIEKGVGGKN